MKYYKLLTLDGWGNKHYSLNKVYQEDCIICLNSIKTKVKEYPKDWIEVPEYEYYLQEGLPEKYYIKVTNDEDDSLLCEHFHGMKGCKSVTGIWFYYSDLDISNTPCKSHDNYTEISFDTFKRLILKQNDMKDREIIGYKLKDDCKQYIPACASIVGLNYPTAFFDNGITVQASIKIEKAGVLNLWFEPVYKAEYQVGDWVSFYSQLFNKTITSKIKEWGSSSYCYLENGEQPFKHLLRKATPEEIKAAQYPQIEINGYKGKFFDDYVKFGCAKIEKAYILKINDILSNTYWKRSDYKTITSITIGKGTFTEEQIKLIAEYYINK